jgi:alpha,alpha-trehalose phosphorylase
VVDDLADLLGRRPGGTAGGTGKGPVVIIHNAFPTEAWRLREVQLDTEVLAQSESLFALSNGHIGLRGNLDEGEPHGLPGSYLNGVYELRPLPSAEAGYGYPESGQTVIDVTNGKIIRLLVDDEPLDVRYGELLRHERILDFRDGVLTRDCEWVSPAGQAVRVRSTRIVSLTQRSIAAICYEVEPLADDARIVVQSELVANEALPPAGADPRVAEVLDAPLAAEEHAADDRGGYLIHTVRRSGLRVAAAMDHLVEGPDDILIRTEALPDLARLTVACELPAGSRLRLVKLIAYGWSAQRSLPALRDEVAAALAAAGQTGWEALRNDQRAYLDDYWMRADVLVEGDAALQQAVRFGLFHVLQAGARAERRSIPTKGLTGTGYDGHCFWDTERFVLPVLTHTNPSATEDALRWRHDTMPLAEQRAEQLGLSGAAFPWRTINGQECSGYWPAGTAAFHVNADIADAVVRYVDATGNHAFERRTGLPLLVQTARLWRSLGHHDVDGAFRIDGVTGPDEYSALADNNVYTNLMAQRNLTAAAAAVERHPSRARQLHVTDDEIASWRIAATAMVVPYDERLGVHPQAEGFTRHQRWDFDKYGADCYPLLLHAPYFELYRKQVVKQADLVFAIQLHPAAFTDEQKRRDFDYYEQITVRDSSLSACTQAVVAAEVGHLDLAYDYAVEAALMDLDDLEHNTRDGLHLASLAGAWIALVAGFGGTRDAEPTLSFRPRLPQDLTRLVFRLTRRNRQLQVTVTQQDAAYTLVAGDRALEVRHYGESLSVPTDEEVRRPIPPLQPRQRPTQPPGRDPRQRAADVRPR